MSTQQNSLKTLIGNVLTTFENESDINIRSLAASFGESSGIPWSPALDMVETCNTLYIYMEIAGVSPSSINLDFYANKLVLTGTRSAPYTDNVVRKEIMYGSFEKKVTLPFIVLHKENIVTKVENGMLCIVIDKTKENVGKFNVKVN